jgi:tetratricopeptide (TPR) repeat protein
VHSLNHPSPPPPPPPPAAAPTGPTRIQAAPPARRGWGAGALVAIAALLLVVAGAVALLTSGGGEEPRDQPTAQREPQRTSTPESTRTATATPTETPATATPTPTPTPEPTEAAPPPEDKEKKPKKGDAEVAGDDPTALQLRAFELNNAGDPQQALGFAERAVELCEDSQAIICAYALYEYARALRMTGDPAGAIAALEERMRRFPDNQPGTVRQELERAREAAGQSD